MPSTVSSLSFFFNDTATTEIYTLSLHDALPISTRTPTSWGEVPAGQPSKGPMDAPRFRVATSRPESGPVRARAGFEDRKSTRLNSSHVEISYAVFCLKKKKNTKKVNL